MAGGDFRGSGVAHLGLGREGGLGLGSTFRQKLESVYYIALLVVGGGGMGVGEQGGGTAQGQKPLVYSPLLRALEESER